MDHLTIIREFLHDRLGINPAQVTPETTLADLDVDSLVMLDMMFELEEKLGIVLTKDIPVIHTVGELLALLDKLQAVAKS